MLIIWHAGNYFNFMRKLSHLWYFETTSYHTYSTEGKKCHECLYNTVVFAAELCWRHHWITWITMMHWSSWCLKKPWMLPSNSGQVLTKQTLHIHNSCIPRNKSNNVPQETCHMKLLPSQHKLCVHHTTMHQFTVSLHVICRVHFCLALTCHLHLWQNEWDLLHAAAVTHL